MPIITVIDLQEEEGGKTHVTLGEEERRGGGSKTREANGLLGKGVGNKEEVSPLF